jgi:hypothetical protein
VLVGNRERIQVEKTVRGRDEVEGVRTVVLLLHGRVSARLDLGPVDLLAAAELTTVRSRFDAAIE